MAHVSYTSPLGMQIKYVNINNEDYWGRGVG